MPQFWFRRLPSCVRRFCVVLSTSRAFEWYLAWTRWMKTTSDPARTSMRRCPLPEKLDNHRNSTRCWSRGILHHHQCLEKLWARITTTQVRISFFQLDYSSFYLTIHLQDNFSPVQPIRFKLNERVRFNDNHACFDFMIHSISVQWIQFVSKLNERLWLL